MGRSRRGPLGELARSGYWREEDAAVVVIALAESGLSVAAFAREHGLSPARLHRWRKRLGRPLESGSGKGVVPATGEGSPIQFHRVRVVPPSGSSGSGESSELELRVGSRRIVVRRGFDRELLEELVRAVEGWSGC